MFPLRRLTNKLLSGWPRREQAPGAGAPATLAGAAQEIALAPWRFKVRRKPRDPERLQGLYPGRSLEGRGLRVWFQDRVWLPLEGRRRQEGS